MIHLSEILGRLLLSEVRGELLVLFHKNPGLMDTIDGVARRIGRQANSITADVDGLIELGIIRKKQIGVSEVLVLNHTRDKEIQDQIGTYLRSLKDKKGV